MAVQLTLNQKMVVRFHLGLPIVRYDMLFVIVYTDETQITKEFGCEEECAEWCQLEGDHVLYFERIK